MNHRALLKKYMLHVNSEEGVMFLPEMYDQGRKPAELDHDDINELRALEAELTAEGK